MAAKLQEFFTGFKTGFWCVLDAILSYSEEGITVLHQKTSKKVQEI